MRLTNKELQSYYHLINKRFFNGACSATIKCRFVDGDEIDGDDGESCGDDLWINSDLQNHPDLAIVVLLHEMAHVAQPEYVGWTKKGRHGHRFEALIGELYKKGAYDGLL